MTALFRGAEDSNFSPHGAPSVSTTAGTFRPGYARCSLVGTISSFWRIPYYYGISVTDSWFTTRINTQADFGGEILLTFLSTGDATRLVISLGNLNGAGSGVLYLYKADNTFIRGSNSTTGLTQLAVSTGPLALGTLTKLDVHVNYAVSGSVNIFADGDLLLSYTGDVTTNSVTALTGADLGGVNSSWFSEVIWDTTDTRSMGLVSIVPAAPGATDQWSGSVSDVNEIVLDEATFNSTLTANQTQVYTGNALPAGQFAILDYTNTMRAAAQAGGPQHIDHVVVTHGTQFVSPTATPVVSLGEFFYTWPTNPATGVAWTQAEINALNLGMESIA